MAHRPHISRRNFLRSTALGTGAFALGASPLARAYLSAQQGLPIPAESGIEHIVLVMMENRSFDHFLGWLPGADGKQRGLVYLDDDGAAHRTRPLAPDFQGCGHPDPDHSYEGGRIEYNGSACDGWLRAGENDEFSIGFYTAKDLPFFDGAARDWTVCDRYFASIMAETFPNRIYQHAAQTDRLTNTLDISTLPTIWDRLAGRGIEGRYYFSDVPVLGLWGTRYIPIARPFVSFLADCAAGTLPPVSYVDPRFVDEQSGTSGDDHPRADIRNGQAFLHQIYRAVTGGPGWQNTLLIINYDEWGGFFDHVPPPTAAIPPADVLAGNADGLLGFRVPCLLISPWSLRSDVSHATFDHTSVLRLIEWRWDLEPLTERDASANNLADALDLRRAKLKAPSYAVPAGPFGAACPIEAGPILGNEWTGVRELARAYGWPL